MMRILINPATVAPGQVSFRVVNAGVLNHELVVLPLAKGQYLGQRAIGPDGKVDEAGSLGEAHAPAAPTGVRTIRATPGSPLGGQRLDDRHAHTGPLRVDLQHHRSLLDRDVRGTRCQPAEVAPRETGKHRREEVEEHVHRHTPDDRRSGNSGPRQFSGSCRAQRQHRRQCPTRSVDLCVSISGRCPKPVGPPPGCWGGADGIWYPPDCWGGPGQWGDRA